MDGSGCVPAKLCLQKQEVGGIWSRLNPLQLVPLKFQRLLNEWMDWRGMIATRPDLWWLSLSLWEGEWIQGWGSVFTLSQPLTCRVTLGQLPSVARLQLLVHKAEAIPTHVVDYDERTKYNRSTWK